MLFSTTNGLDYLLNGTNLTKGFIGKRGFLTEGDRQEYLHHPIIIHFLSSLKPWQDIPGLRYRDLYYKYLALTEWKDFVPQRRPSESYYGLRKMIFFSNMQLWLSEHEVHFIFTILWMHWLRPNVY